MTMKLKTTEKAVRLIEAENTLVVETERQKRKEAIKKEFSEMFNVRIADIRTHIQGNKKIAYIKLSPENLAIDVATKIGMI